MSTEHPDDHPSKDELLTATKRIVESREKSEPGNASIHRVSKKAEGNKTDWSSQGALVFGSVLGVIVFLYALIGICRPSLRPSKPPLSDASMIPLVVEYGGEQIPGKAFVGMEATRTMKDKELVSEIKQIAVAKALPGEVFANDVPHEMNVAHELSKLFKIYKDNPGELDKLRQGISNGEWKIDGKTLEQVSDILTRVEPKRQDIRAMLERKDVCFSFEFVETQDGPAPNTDGADFMDDYVLLEEYAIARALLEGTIEKATESLAYIFRIAQLAAEVRSPEIRSKAAKIRRRALDVTQTVVLDPKFVKKDLIDLYEILKEQLDHWTDDAEAWIGDRANGLKVYNLIVQYGPEAALEENEVAELTQRGILEKYIKRKDLVKTIVKDQIVYLRTMKSVIEECGKPYYQRRSLFARIFSDIQLQKNSPEEPIITEFLLRGIPELMEYIAFDRTECETAFLAMSLSLKRPIPPKQFELDPLYGKKYETRSMINPKEPKIPIVWTSYANSLKPFRVPDYSNGE